MVALALSCHRESKFLVQHKRLSDRVGFADFKFPHPLNGKSKNKILDVRFVAAYVPTSPLEHVKHGKEASTGSVCGQLQQQRQAERQW